jgi:hypothetical protein
MTHTKIRSGVWSIPKHKMTHAFNASFYFTVLMTFCVEELSSFLPIIFISLDPKHPPSQGLETFLSLWGSQDGPGGGSRCRSTNAAAKRTDWRRFYGSREGNLEELRVSLSLRNRGYERLGRKKKGFSSFPEGESLLNQTVTGWTEAKLGVYWEKRYKRKQLESSVKTDYNL